MLDKLFFKKKSPENHTFKEENIPKHVAIIMDGNGRWARKRAMPRIAGHHEGMKTVRKIVKEANKIGIEVLTLYAFSTENWKRPREEVDFLMKLPGEFLNTFLPDLIKENVQVRIMGKKELLPLHTVKAVDEAINKTKNNTGLILNFALNYGSRDEITAAVKALASEVKQGRLEPSDIDDSMIEQHLMTHDLKDPDLLIRTSGEVRLSNFMLWQLAYSEFWFTEVLWPDFSEEHLREAVSQFAGRGRRYGGV
ncbi:MULTISPECIES: isoprenyl transferase [Fictibacillus]|jgi:undecaprenyl diphosphate synthase|uniref:isoprenyl transferase n=1 Tax=Fictibacillus TaxID=1329200 RepID=UPI0018CEE6B6|nr:MULTISPECIES: isoprenyl transferase [unclassified Fictibacillus]MBH0155915.1 isoprenyl transferase [Fictibacillus sp. 5RED26]MBH0165843.1 isoprenyl transferase [Fictibacillus sp. 7GRE50]MBH0173108.1 isoprenyl transferase [Fictibacillus sp. 23RED33]